MAIGAGGPWQLFTSFNGATSASVKQSHGAIRSCYAENRHSSKQYLQIFDKVGVPEAGEIPRISVPMPAGGGGFVLDDTLWGDEGQGFQRGLAFGISSTVETYTEGNASVSIHIWYF